jgi:hypothetical protein
LGSLVYCFRHARLTMYSDLLQALHMHVNRKRAVSPQECVWMPFELSARCTMKLASSNISHNSLQR